MNVYYELSAQDGSLLCTCVKTLTKRRISESQINITCNNRAYQSWTKLRNTTFTLDELSLHTRVVIWTKLFVIVILNVMTRDSE